MKRDDLLEMLQLVVARAFACIPRKRPSSHQLNGVKIIAHRGNGVWEGKISIENTLEAIEQCVNNGVWGVECDLRWSKDNVPVISHDDCTSRVFQKPLAISQTSFNELREKFPLIPKLSEVVEVIKNKTHLMLELKQCLTPEQLMILQHELSELDFEKDFHLMSLNPDIFNSCKGFAKNSWVSIAEFSTSKTLRKTWSESWGGYTGHFLLTRKAMIKMCKDRGVCVGTGFVDSENVFFREVQRDVDWVFTNRPERLMRAVQNCK